jgi:glycosyltransferase involved in cell wall biosynthesis
LRRLVRELNPQLLHTHGVKPALLGAWARPAGTAVVWHVHDYLSPRPLAARLLPMSSKRVAGAIAVSRSVAADVTAVCGPGLPVAAIHNAVDLEEFSPSGPTADLDRLAGMAPAPPGTIKVGMVATLAHWKGHQTFLDALSRLPADLPLRGYVVGGGIYRSRNSQLAQGELAALRDRLGLHDRVGFTGFVDRPADALRALDIVVHASIRPEPFGLVVSEAMATGRAVVASATGGVTEFLDPGADALVHPPGDAACLSERILEAAGNRCLRERLGLAARAKAERMFDRRRFAAEVLAVYRRIAPGAVL